MKIIIYEDRLERFAPLVNFYPQFMLRVGIKTILDNIQNYFPKAKFDFLTREAFGAKASAKSGPVMYLSGRLLLKERIDLPSEEVRLMVDNETVGFLKTAPPYPATLAEAERETRQNRKVKKVSGRVLNNLCDLVKFSEDLIVEQFPRTKGRSKKPRGFDLVGSQKMIFIAPDATLHRTVAIDVTEGPVFIDHKAVIRPFTTIIGPSYIGPQTMIDRAKVVKSSIGPSCRIGGEVEASVFQGFSNKYHEGFLGHSFIGEWVNLGALTTNSDLKNNYGPVRIKIGREVIDSGLIKLGCMIGDHAKLGIGTLIPTGTVIGSFVNFFGGGMMPRFVPSFKWLGPGIDESYELEKALATARAVMKRRGVEMTTGYEALVRDCYKNKPGN
jgi:UDP-N-acetylglucosamine diphosphorylase/glucosamine-1-phosphate N-acetyltransferase